MLLWILVALVLTAVVVVAAGWSVPTPIPNHVAKRTSEIRQPGGLGLTVYRIVLVGVAVVGTWLVVTLNPGGTLAFVLAAILIWIYMDDLQATLQDVWNGNFWRFDP